MRAYTSCRPTANDICNSSYIYICAAQYKNSLRGYKYTYVDIGIYNAGINSEDITEIDNLEIGAFCAWMSSFLRVHGWIVQFNLIS